MNDDGQDKKRSTSLLIKMDHNKVWYSIVSKDSSARVKEVQHSIAPNSPEKKVVKETKVRIPNYPRYPEN